MMPWNDNAIYNYYYYHPKDFNAAKGIFLFFWKVPLQCSGTIWVNPFTVSLIYYLAF